MKYGKWILVALLVLIFPCLAAAEVSSQAFLLPVEQLSEPPAGYTALYTKEDLEQIIDHPSGQFILMDNIDLEGDNPFAMTGFEGVLDGNGYQLTGLYVEGHANFRDTYSFGLFPWVKNATISNLYVQGKILMVDSGYYDAAANVGGIAGRAWGNSTITNCVSDVQITCDERMIEDIFQHMGGYVGGVVGRLDCFDGATISYCHNLGYISAGENVGGITGCAATTPMHDLQQPAIFACQNDGEVIARWGVVGGIVGYTANNAAMGSQSLSIDSCANMGNVTGCFTVGGIVGYCDRETSAGCITVVDCLNAGFVTGTDRPVVCVGGIVGDGDCVVSNSVNVGTLQANVPSGIHTNISPENLRDCYYLDNARGAMFKPDGTLLTDGMLTSEQMKSKESFPALSFDAKWTLEEGMAYPIPTALLGIANRWIVYASDAWESDLAAMKGNTLRENAIESIMNGYEFTEEERAGVIICFAEGYGAYPGGGASDRSSALCVVWRNGEIIFVADNCSTYPDYPTQASRNGGTPMPTLMDGKYTATATNHLMSNAGFNYPALKVQSPQLCRVRDDGSYYTETMAASSINIHSKSTETLGMNSQGCTVVGTAQLRVNGLTNVPAGNEYTRFAYLVGFAADQNGDGYAEIKSGVSHLTASCTVIYNRAYGYANVPEFRANFDADYGGMADIIQTILGQ